MGPQDAPVSLQDAPVSPCQARLRLRTSISTPRPTPLRQGVFLVPTRCVGTWLLRAAEGIRPVSGIRIPGNHTCRRSGVIGCGPEGVCSGRCQQLVMGSVSRLKDGGPSWPGTADILSAPGITDILFLVPTRCVGSWLLRAAEGIRPVVYTVITPAGGPALLSGAAQRASAVSVAASW